MKYKREIFFPSFCFLCAFCRVYFYCRIWFLFCCLSSTLFGSLLAIWWCPKSSLFPLYPGKQTSHVLLHRSVGDEFVLRRLLPNQQASDIWTLFLLLLCSRGSCFAELLFLFTVLLLCSRYCCCVRGVAVCVRGVAVCVSCWSFALLVLLFLFAVAIVAAASVAVSLFVVLLYYFIYCI